MHTFTFAFILILVAIIIFLTYYLEFRRKNSSWVGTLENKKITDYFYKGRHSNVYILYITKDNGEKVTYNVDESFYNNLHVGDRVTKDKGSYYPTKLI